MTPVHNDELIAIITSLLSASPSLLLSALLLNTFRVFGNEYCCERDSSEQQYSVHQ
jgi:hypothetical protein